MRLELEVSEKTIFFVQKLVARFPGLVARFDEHREHNFGAVLPHVFFGELTRYVVKLEEGEAWPELQAILDHLEGTFAAGDDELMTLISVSFLENLPRDGESIARIRCMMGPHLERELQAME
jgi:hypothetical protein